ncbi:MAG: trigger factor [Sphingomonadales bacterium]|nr:trigger factor [Sphingomonadales bacterium]MBU3992134.1 trigger factor [Alphaproteobacteria bacterium]
MQIVETSNEGLKRAYAITIEATQIARRIEDEITKIAPQVKMPGFRPGKVPANLVRKMHGPALHQDALNTVIREAMDLLVTDKQLRPAMQPQVSLGEGYEEGKDAELTVSLEVLPVIATPSLEGLKLEKLVVPVSQEQVDEAVARIAEGSKNYTDAEPGKVAENGDQLVVDFLGKLDGVPFEGGAAEDAAIELGANRFIPGFEEQLVGVKAGDERQITVTFPADYPAENLAGKETTFDVTVKAVKVAGETTIDDDFAKNLGLESLEQLTGLLRGQLEQETAGLTRTQMKRQLLDLLAADHEFEVPPSMVEAEFDQIWQQLTHEAGHEEDTEAALKELESEKDDYRNIAVRRVRLGLLLSEIGQANGIDVSQQEMSMLLNQAAQQYRPEDRDRFVEYIRNEPLAAAQLRAPLYEDKVVDFLFDKAEVTEREVTKEELQAAIEADEGATGGHVHGPDCGHDHGHDEKPAKKPAAKKAKAEPAAEEAPAAKEAPVKKAAPKKKAAAADAPAGEAPKKRAPAKKKTEV